MTEKYLTRKELADRWGVTTATLRNWAAKKYGATPHQFGFRHVVYKLSDVEKHEEQNPIFKNPPRNKES